MESTGNSGSKSTKSTDIPLPGREIKIKDKEKCDGRTQRSKKIT